LYLDESGDPTTWLAQKHFVLGGIAVFEGWVWRLADELDKIQARYFPNLAFQIPFHASAVSSGHERFRTLDEQKRRELMNDVYKCIATARFPNLVAFATALNESCVQSGSQVLRDTFQDVCQRFNTFLVRQYKSGRPSKGMLIMDAAHESRYRELITDFRRKGTAYGLLDNIVDVPYFGRRHDTRMIQLADFCAYAVFRYYDYNDDDHLNMVLPRFDRRAPGGPPEGLKHITEEKDCPCVACSWRHGRQRTRFRRT